MYFLGSDQFYFKLLQRTGSRDADAVILPIKIPFKAKFSSKVCLEVNMENSIKSIFMKSFFSCPASFKSFIFWRKEFSESFWCVQHINSELVFHHEIVTLQWV